MLSLVRSWWTGFTNWVNTESYTDKLSPSEQTLFWEHTHRHSAGVCMVCPDCGYATAWECPCAKKKFFAELSDEEVTVFRQKLRTTCPKCHLNLVACDCEYQEAVRALT